jgi:DNA-directed RNA polymerase subunit RPC12/RpoP
MAEAHHETLRRQTDQQSLLGSGPQSEPRELVPPELKKMPDGAGIGLSRPGQVVVYTCSNCTGNVPEHIGAGENCPHCGVRFDYVEEPNGERTYADDSGSGGRIRIRGLIKLVASIVCLVCGGIATLWRKYGR